MRFKRIKRDHPGLSKVDQLRAEATAAAQVRAYQTHPDVVALLVERVRSQVDALLWVGIALGLAFTMVNVQTFAASGAPVGSLPWCAAWVLDPMVSLVLIAVLRAEQVTARYQVDTAGWVRCTKIFAFAATYAMNTWSSWQHLNAAGIVLHSVPPLLVYCAAEAGPTVRDRLTEAVLRAARLATTDTTAPAETATAGEPVAITTAPAVAEPVNAAVNEAVNADLNAGPAEADAVAEAAPVVVAGPVRERRSRVRRAARPAPRRKLRAEFVAEARAAWTPEVAVTPAWVRQVTDCSRGLSSAIAADLRAGLAAEAAPVAELAELPQTTAVVAPAGLASAELAGVGVA